MQHDIIDEAHGIHDSSGQLGHGDERDRRKPTAVTSIVIPHAARDSRRTGDLALSYMNEGDDINWRATQVACGLDHMAAIITLDEAWPEL